MKVKAITDGFYGGARRRAGAVFEVPAGTTGHWLEVVADDTPVERPRQKAKKQEPIALSQLQADQPVSEREVI
jgi:hypothetical protein